jgi:ribonucleotide monophosphatase NagD (HAD superfamily)
LQILNGNNKQNIKFPFICVTNGGGTLEVARSKKLTGELGVRIALHQIVQSHTIFRKLAPQYQDLPVLVVGGKDDNVRQVAHDYGFKQAYIPEDIVYWWHAVWPFQKLSEREVAYVKVCAVSSRSGVGSTIAVD